MGNKKIAFFSATQKNTAAETSLLKSTLNFDMDVDIAFALSNTEHLAVVYNRAIDAALKEDWDALAFVHDDVILEHDPRPKLSKLFDEYDMIGVAGTSSIELKSPALWHLMGGGFGSGKLHGAVAHGDEKRKHMTSFGVYPHRVVMIDGVFIAMNRTLMEKLRFDETNPSKYHFYDLDISSAAHKMGCRVGVGDIHITHQSEGLREFTDDWKAGESWFLKKYES
jgi:GT2 family glycosyltransferase